MQDKFTKDRKPTPQHPKEVDSLQQSVSSLMAQVSEDKKGMIQLLVDLVKEFKKDQGLTEDARNVKAVNQIVLSHRDVLRKMIKKDTQTSEDISQAIDLSGIDLSDALEKTNVKKKDIVNAVRTALSKVEDEEKIQVSYKPKLKTVYKILEDKVAGERYFENVEGFIEKRISDRMSAQKNAISEKEMMSDFENAGRKKTKNVRKESKTGVASSSVVTKRKDLTKVVMKIRKPKPQQKRIGTSILVQKSRVGQILSGKVPAKKRSIGQISVPVQNKRTRNTIIVTKSATDRMGYRSKNVPTQESPKAGRTVIRLVPEDLQKRIAVEYSRKTVDPMQKKGHEEGSTGELRKEKKKPLLKKRKVGQIAVPQKKTKPKVEKKESVRSRSVGIVGRILPFVKTKQEKKKPAVGAQVKTEQTKSENAKELGAIPNFMIGFDSTQEFIKTKMMSTLKVLPKMILRSFLSGSKKLIVKAVSALFPVVGIILKVLKPFLFLMKWVWRGAKGLFKVISSALSLSFGLVKKTLYFVTIGWMKGLYGLHKKIMKVLKSNVVKKIVSFLFSPKGAFILGFIVGFLYKHVYLPIKNNWMKIKRTIKKAYLAAKSTILKGILAVGQFYNDTFVPGYNKIREHLNGLDVEKLDQMALEFKRRIFYPIQDIMDFLKETLKEVPALAGSMIGGYIGSFFGPIGGLAGSIIGGLIGGLVTDAFGDKFKDELDERTKKENRERDIVESYGFSEKTNRRKNIINDAMKRVSKMDDKELKANASDIQKLNKMRDANRYLMNSDDEESMIPQDFDVETLGRQINDELADTKTKIDKGYLDKGQQQAEESKIPLPGDVPYKDTLIRRYVRAILLSRMYNWFRDGMATKWDLYSYYNNMFQNGDFSDGMKKETLNTYTVDPNTGAKKEKTMTVQQVLEGDFSSFRDRNGNKILQTSGLAARGQLLKMEGETHEKAKASDQFIKNQVEGVISKYWGVMFDGIPKEEHTEAVEIIRKFLMKSYNSSRWQHDKNGNILFTKDNALEVNKNLRDLYQTVQLYGETLKSHKFVHMAELGKIDMDNVSRMYDESSKELDQMLKEDKAAEEQNRAKVQSEMEQSGNGMVGAVIGKVVQKVNDRKNKEGVVVQNNRRSDLFAAK